MDQDHCFSPTRNPDRRPLSTALPLPLPLPQPTHPPSHPLLRCMLCCRGYRWLSPLVPPSSDCRLPRHFSRFSLSPVSSMGERAGRGGSADAEASKSTTSSSVIAAHKDEIYLDGVIQKRIKLFETIQAQQKKERLKLNGEPIKIKLLDGTIKEGKKWLTSPLDIANEISARLAASSLIAQVNGTLWDMTVPLEGDSDLKFFQFDDNEGRDTFWHSSAHILGQGFYYDAFYNDLTLNEDNFNQIQSRASKSVGEKQRFERIEVTREQALEMFAENKFKVREAQLAQYNYILVVGEEEAKTGQVSVRVRDGSDHSVMSLDALLEHFRKEVEAYH